MRDIISLASHSTEEAISWIESLGLDPHAIPRSQCWIDRDAKVLIWREFATDEDGHRVQTDGPSSPQIAYGPLRRRRVGTLPATGGRPVAADETEAPTCYCTVPELTE